MAQPIPLNLVEEADTKEERDIAQTIRNLVDNEVDAIGAAKEINNTILTETQQATEPDAVGWQYYLWDCLGTSAMEIPATHPAQDRLVGLIKELQALPKSQARQKYRNKDSIESKELWTLTPLDNYDGFEQWLWDLNEGRFVGGRQVEKSEDVAQKYINFSAFLARLLAAKQVEAVRLSALMPPNPFSKQIPASRSESQYGVYAAAAAQWIIFAGDALFEMCEKDTPVDFDNQHLTRAKWTSWKGAFDGVARDEDLSSRTRDFARVVVARMRKIEDDGITTTVTEKFGAIKK